MKAWDFEDIISRIQFDRWIFGVPTLFTLVSHGDSDHDPLKSAFAFPEPLVHSENYEPEKRSLNKTFVMEGHLINVKGVKVIPVGPKYLSHLIKSQVQRLHAYWWFLIIKGRAALFVGDIYAQEIPLLRRLLEIASNLDILLLPSYGCMEPGTHGVAYKEQLKEEIASIAKEQKERGALLYALPHPVAPDWADRAANIV